MTGGGSKKLLCARDLAVFRGERLVFQGVGFLVRPGGALLLRGANGAGKSTLLRVLAGLLPPAAGTLLWDGEPALADLPEHAARIGWLGHKDGIKTALAVRQSVSDEAALAAVGLEHHAELPALLLSAGQRRRLAFARVVAERRPLWLLDEPTNAMDASSVTRVEAACAAHLSSGGMIVAATHTPLGLPEAEILVL